MAEFDLTFLRPCKTYRALLELNAVASAKYHEATSELVSLAGQEKATGFAESKRNCETCLDECRRTAGAMRTHKATHGCQTSPGRGFERKA